MNQFSWTKLTKSSKREKQKIFQSTISTILDMLTMTPLDIEKTQILDYAINIIGGELSYSASAKLLYQGEKWNGGASYAIPTPVSAISDRRNLSLADLNVVIDIFDTNKLRKAIPQVFLQGFRQINNYTGTFYPEINLVVIDNGRHHLSAAAVKNVGSATLQICNLKDVFSTLRTDGAYWYYVADPPMPVYDYRIAVLYELARIRSELMLPDMDTSLSGREYPIPDRTNPLTAYRESLFRSELLELELEIKKSQIRLLKGELDSTSMDAELERLEKVSANIKKEFNAWIEQEGEPLRKVYHSSNDI